MSADPSRVLGRRIGAALIDIALLLALFVAVGAVVGGLHHHGSSYGVHLHTGGTLLYVALVYGYYFATEAFLAGRTVGKALLGLRVAGPGGAPATTGQIAGRTALRVIDGLPVLYLVGFVCVLITGARAQRLGDLAAGTSVVRAPQGAVTAQVP